MFVLVTCQTPNVVPDARVSTLKRGLEARFACRLVTNPLKSQEPAVLYHGHTTGWTSRALPSACHTWSIFAYHGNLIRGYDATSLEPRVFTNEPWARPGVE
jgi:hypothetical protein